MTGHGPERQESDQNIKDYFGRHKLIKRATEFVLRGALDIDAFLTDGPEGLRARRDPARMSGLLEGTILAPRLCFPDEVDDTLIFERAGAGEWLSYDFNRPLEFPKSSERDDFYQTKEGVLWAYMPESMKEQPASQKTPLRIITHHTLDFLADFDKRSPQTLAEEGFLLRTTHAEAYERVGATEYIDGLRARSVDKESVYQVTPKGNSLLWLLDDDGDPTPKEEHQLELSRIPGLLAY